LAYRFAPKFVLRAGYGLSRLGQEGWGPAMGYAQTTSRITTLDDGLTPAAGLSNPFPTSLFPNGLIKPVGNSLGAMTQMGLGLSADYVDRDLPYSQQYSVGFQREMPGNWLLDGSYVGNYTKRLPVSIGLNFIPTSVLESQPVASRPSYFTQQVPVGWQRSDQAQFKATRGSTDAQRNANAQAAGHPQWDPQFDTFFNTTLFPKTAPAAYTLRNFPTRFPDVPPDMQNDVKMVVLVGKIVW
jgi:hypothetical protein